MANNDTKDSKRNGETKAPDMLVWHVSEKGEKGFWTRIGAAWKHKDGEGFTLQLDLVPAGGGRIVLRTPDKAETDKEGRA